MASVTCCCFLYLFLVTKPCVAGTKKPNQFHKTNTSTMRFYVKGGVWKNSEDEILKAGIMKYGKNNWARVASLLPRKSSKQCKARWFEWLDPSVKKTEWSRTEDEKLLHMVKIMPTQWRSIAPVVGRTAAQCLQRYDQLLEQAAKLDAASPEEAEAIANAARDAKRLRPGEIDPAPEIKPARPDAIDMDEDELEMLSEARARLANTKGKKAKRKSREKQLAEARRLAKLQKRRELKEAGLIRGGDRDGGGASRNSSRASKRSREIDYNREIPFHTKTPAGFYDTTAEDSISSNPEFVKRTRRELTGKIRAEEENNKRKEDKKKHRKLLSTNLPAMIDKLSALNDPRNTVRRSNLILPTPNVNDEEMQTVAKLTEDARRRRLKNDNGTDATRGLLADPRGGTPFTGSQGQGSGIIGNGMMLTPFNGMNNNMSMTPGPGRTEIKKDIIMEQARNLAKMTAQQTPLMGGTSVGLEGGTGWSGGAQPTPAPNRNDGSTTGGIRNGSETPSMMMSHLKNNKRLRDEVNENNMKGPEGRKKRRLRERHARDSLRAKLQGLPEPQYTYEVEVPTDSNDANNENNPNATTLSMDAADVDRYEKLRLQEQEKKEFLKQTLSVQQNLPRPTHTMITKMWISEDGNNLNQNGTEVNTIDRQIRETSLALMWKDAIQKPYVRPGTSTSGVRKSSNGSQPQGMPNVEAEVDLRYVRAADVLIRDAQTSTLNEKETLTMVLKHSSISMEETTKYMKDSKNRKQMESQTNVLIKQNDKKMDKLTRKINVLTKGHRQRSEDTWKDMIEEHLECENMAVELATLHHGSRNFEVSSTNNMKQMDVEISTMRNKERELQSLYAEKSA